MSDTDSMANPSLSVGIDSDLDRIIRTVTAAAPGVGFSVTYRMTRSDGGVTDKIIELQCCPVCTPQKDVA